MPKREMGGQGEERPNNDEAFDYGQPLNPNPEVDTQPLTAIPEKEHIKLFHRDITKAKDIQDVLEALYRHDYLQTAKNLRDAIDYAKRLLSERPTTSKDTIERVLDSSDIFKDKALQTEYPYLDKKIRRFLIAHLKEKLLKEK